MRATSVLKMANTVLNAAIHPVAHPVVRPVSRPVSGPVSQPVTPAVVRPVIHPADPFFRPEYRADAIPESRSRGHANRGVDVFARVLVRGFCAATLMMAGLPAYALPAHFDDPMRTPSQLTPLALQSPVEAVTRAGGGLIAVGLRGHILRQSPGDTHWRQVPVPVSDDLVAVSFPTPMQGWAVGHDGVVLHTADGGMTWQLQLDGPRAYQTMVSYYQRAEQQGVSGATQELTRLREVASGAVAWPFLDVWFRDAAHGYIVGAFGMIMSTEDGGQHWLPLLDHTDNPRHYHLYAIKGQAPSQIPMPAQATAQDPRKDPKNVLATGDVFIVGEHGLVLRLDSVTQRFVAQPLAYRGSLFGVAFQGERVVVYGLRGHAFVSAREGDPWQAVSTGTTFGIVGATLLTDGDLLLATEYGRLLSLPPGALATHLAGTTSSGAAMGIAQASDGRIVAATSLGPKTFDLDAQP